jgi:4-amino-4-deoxy-L-arabinose transferase-like glycosyltransferase
MTRPAAKPPYQGLRRRKLRLLIIIWPVLTIAALTFDVCIADRLANDEPDDGRLYSKFARNLVDRGVFSADDSEPFTPSMIRLPGYPLLVAVVYRAFGEGNDRAVRIVQGILHFITAVIAAAIAWVWCFGTRRRRRKAAVWSFVLTAFCPFTAIYSATLLSEVPATLFLALGIFSATLALTTRNLVSAAFWWAASGIYFGGDVLIRPDSGLFAFGAGMTLLGSFLMRKPFRKAFLAVIACGAAFCLAFALMLVPWTIRNERVFSVFQPLAPAHAEAPGEFVPEGYFLWLRTWIDDQRYIGPMLWDLEEKPIMIGSVPDSAFDTDNERARVAALLDQYNHSSPPDEASPDDDRSNSDEQSPDTDDDNNNEVSDDVGEQDLTVTPEVDAGFRAIANERIQRHPVRFYLVLPAKRAVSMWFDTHSKYYPFDGELFPLHDLDTETYQHLWLPAFAALVWMYTVGAVFGIALLWFARNGKGRVWVLMAIFLSLPRVVYFSTLENPEPRYFVELFLLAAILTGVALSIFRIRKGNGAIWLELKYK